MTMNTSYAEMERAFAGMLADASRRKHVEPYLQGEASAEIAFGWGVVEGTAAPVFGQYNKALIPPDANGVFAGVLIHADTYEPRTQLGDTGVKPGAALNVLKEGACYVYVEDAVTKGQQLFLRHTANGAGKVPGQFRSDADTAKAIEVPVVTREATTGAGLVQVDVDVLAGKIAAQT